jgi:hypothetical protein
VHSGAWTDGTATSQGRHEAGLRVVGSEREMDWLGRDRGHALALRVLVGMATERIRVDHKGAVVLRQYEERTAPARRWLMELEADTSRGDALPAASLLEQEVHLD